jgi:DNA-binding transcriptional LysR family regulator
MLLSPSDLQILVRLEGGMTQSQIGNDLGLEQPAVSKAIHAAEQRLGMSLVHGDGRRLKLTNVGREVARAAAGVLMQVRAVDDLIVSLRAGRMTHTRILASTTPGTYLLPAIIAQFLRENADAQIEIDVVAMPNLWDEFASGSYDFALCPGLPVVAAAGVEQVYVDPVLFFTSRDHRLAREPRISFDDLRAEPLVGKLSDPYWTRVHRDLQERGYAFSETIDLSTAEAVKGIVAAGTGVGVLFESAVRAELERGDLVSLPFSGLRYEQTYFIVRPAREATPQTDRICAYLREELSRVRRA